MNKYHNKPTTIDGIRFASIAESCRYKELVWMQNAKRITDLELQPKYKLAIDGELITTYIADFRYKIVGSGVTVVEDVKGFRTQEYKIKKRLMKVLLKIDVIEID